VPRPHIAMRKIRDNAAPRVMRRRHVALNDPGGNGGALARVGAALSEAVKEGH
jgi:hypothetical protein